MSDTRTLATDLLASLDRDIAIAQATGDWNARDSLRGIRHYAYAVSAGLGAIAGAREIDQHADQDGGYVLHIGRRMMRSR
jgi:hypothetical protein